MSQSSVVDLPKDLPAGDPLSSLSSESETVREGSFNPPALHSEINTASKTDLEKGAPPKPTKFAGRDPDAVAISLERSRFWLVYLGLEMAIFLAALDQTIVATTLPTMAKDFKALDQISWVGTAYLLSSTAIAPVYGKLADIFGRKPVIMVAIAIFEIGAIICGSAVSIDMLIIGRAIAGLGGGGLISMVQVIISDIVSIRDRPKYQGINGAVFGFASVVGPLVGGAFTDHVTWRWCFYINLPLGVITFFSIAFLLKFPPVTGSMEEKFRRIDWLGTALLIASVVCILTPIQGGGTQFAWNSALSISLFCVGAALLIAFLLVELYVAKEPVIAKSVFMNRTVYATIIVAFFLGICFFVVTFYLPLYFQIIHGDSATLSGIETIPVIGGMVIMSILSGQLISHFGHYKPFLLAGSAIVTVALGLISTLNQNSNRGMQVGYLLLMGIGLGNCLQPRVVAIQAAVDMPKIAVATTLLAFLQNLGAVIGVAIAGAIFNNSLTQSLAGVSSSIPLAALTSGDTEFVHSLPEPLRDQVIAAYVRGLQLAFTVAIPCGGVMFVASFFIKHYRIVKRELPPPKELPAKELPANEGDL